MFNLLPLGAPEKGELLEFMAIVPVLPSGELVTTKMAAPTSPVLPGS